MGLLSAHGAAVGGDVFGVFFEAVGEAVMSLGVGDEIIKITLGGMHGGFEGAASGIADGAGRKSGMAVGVVGRRETHVGVVERTRVSSG